MKSTIKGLYLSVPTPCEENWSQMTRTAAGRHCSSCNKTVVDFSLLSDAEMLAVIANSKGNVCGRFADDQLNRHIAAAAPVHHPFVPAMLITAGLAVSIVTAGHAETRGLERMEMSVSPVPAADTTLQEMRNLPEVVVNGYTPISCRRYTAGAVTTITTTQIIAKNDYDALYYSGKRLINKLIKKKKP
jgi:hypothetical protein